MATEHLQSYDPQNGGIVTDLPTCRIHVPFAHKLISSFFTTQNVVTSSGTVTASLRQTDVGDVRAGSLVGTILENDDLENHSFVCTKFDFVLADKDKGVAPANREYLLMLTGTNSSDRVDEPVLVIEVERV